MAASPSFALTDASAPSASPSSAGASSAGTSLAGVPPASALMDAAERLFIERGVARVGLGEIAVAAGLSPRALRKHYASRDQLLQALQDRFVRDFCAQLDAAMDRCRPGDWSARLRAWVCAAVDGYLDQVALHDMLFHDMRSHDREAWQNSPAVMQLAALLEGGVRARVWVAPDPQLTAVIFCTALHSAVDRAIVSGEPADRQRLSQTLIGYFERSVQWWTRF